MGDAVILMNNNVTLFVPEHQKHRIQACLVVAWELCTHHHEA